MLAGSVRPSLRRLLRRLTGQAGSDQGPAGEVEFYRRLETLPARQGLTRAPQQTQREFAQQTGAAAQATGRAELRLPVQIAETFYGVQATRAVRKAAALKRRSVGTCCRIERQAAVSA